MKLDSVCLIGGSGFLGSHVARQLTARGIDVRIPTRDRERAKDTLILLPTAEVIRGDIHDTAFLRRVVTGVDAVVNLVGVLHDGRGNGFQRNHVDLPKRIVSACRDAGVERVVHVSALGASTTAPSRYLQSKAQGEAEIAAAASHGIATTVFRPSVVFGLGDSFLSLFAAMVRWFPVLPLACANARFQPVFVEDVARAISMSLGSTATHGQTYELCGPTVYTLGDLVRIVAQTLGLQRSVVPLPGSLGMLQAFVLEHLPGRLMTRDNVRSMQVDNVCGCAFPGIFGFAPTPLEAVAPLYLADRTSRARYDRFRYFARR
jgi:NADH dehydrogenase